MSEAEARTSAMRAEAASAAPAWRCDLLDGDLACLLLAERDVSTADAVFHRVTEGGAFDHSDQSSLRETHVQQPAPEGALAGNVSDHRSVTRVE